MGIKFSRHAKRRAKLYGIPESTKERKGKMKVHYDAEVDAIYIKLGHQ